MWKPSHRALKLFFTAFALIALSACGGSSGGGGGDGTAQTPAQTPAHDDGTAANYKPYPSETLPDDPDNPDNKFASWADALRTLSN